MKELTGALQVIQFDVLGVLLDVPTSRIWIQNGTLVFQTGQDENLAHENGENVYGKFTEYVGLFLSTTKIVYKRKLKIKWPVLASFSGK